MIIVTGPGRSGTSLIADIYVTMGVDVGGKWDETLRAGYEDPEIVALNASLLRHLRTSLLGERRAPPDLSSNSQAGIRYLRQWLGVNHRRRLKALYAQRPWNRTTRLGLDWARVAEVTDRWAPRLIETAAGKQVVKDPQFTLTLPIWIASGAPIENVVLSRRDLGAMAQSRVAAGHAGQQRYTWLLNSFIMAYGTALLSCEEAGVPVTQLEFPNMTRDPIALGHSLPLPPGFERVAAVKAAQEVVVPRDGGR